MGQSKCCAKAEPVCCYGGYAVQNIFQAVCVWRVGDNGQTQYISLRSYTSMVSISVGYLSEFSDKSATVTVYTVTKDLITAQNQLQLTEGRM